MRQGNILLGALAFASSGCAGARLETITSRELDLLLSEAVEDGVPGVVFGAVDRDGTEVVRAAGRPI